MAAITTRHNPVVANNGILLPMMMNCDWPGPGHLYFTF